MLRTDVHQHLWTEPLVAELAKRHQAPRARQRDGSWVLELDGEPATALVMDAHRRPAVLDTDAIDRALICVSSPVGIEQLPREQSVALLDAHLEGVREAGDRFAAWGAVPLDDPDPADVDRVLDGGAIGLSLPADALGSPAGVERLAPLLERLDRRGAPLMVHPGPAGGRPDDPGWWPALTDYVASLNRAWQAFVTFGRPAHPGLNVVFAALAGLAPLHAERRASRGAPPAAADERLFYDTSSYGPVAVSAMIDAVGPDQLVLGSDRPVLDPRPWPVSGRVAWLHGQIRAQNPARLLGAFA
jgi:predicted TIM-barrel fold metal-dependent hydrolase